LGYLPHKGMSEFVSALNLFYKQTPSLYEKAFSDEGFEWISYQDNSNSIISYIRKGHDVENDAIIVCNFTPTAHLDYAIGLPRAGSLVEVMNSDELVYGGSGVHNEAKVKIQKEPWDDRPFSARFKVPPLGIVVFQYEKS